MSLFEPFPSTAQLYPVQLHRVRSEWSGKLRRAGLLGADNDLRSQQQMQAIAQRVKSDLVSSKKLDRNMRRRLPNLVTWAYQMDTGLNEAVLSAVDQRLVPLSARLLWSLLCLNYDDGDALSLLTARFRSMPARQQNRVGPASATVAAIGRPGALPKVLAKGVVRSRTSLLRVSDEVRVPADTPLMDATWRALIHHDHIHWWLRRPIGELEQFLANCRESVRVGAVGRLLLEPLVGAGLEPSMVASGEPLARLVAAVGTAMPRNLGHPAWDELGAKATMAVRWWRTQGAIEEFFGDWNADPERSAYWLGFVTSVVDVEPYQSANALAMRIGDYWFVEFGRTGNAAFAYPDSMWRAEQRTRERATDEGDLKTLGGRSAARQPHRETHNSGWNSKFDTWVFQLTSQRRRRR